MDKLEQQAGCSMVDVVAAMTTLSEQINRLTIEIESLTKTVNQALVLMEDTIEHADFDAEYAIGERAINTPL